MWPAVGSRLRGFFLCMWVSELSSNGQAAGKLCGLPGGSFVSWYGLSH